MEQRTLKLVQINMDVGLLLAALLGAVLLHSNSLAGGIYIYNVAVVMQLTCCVLCIYNILSTACMSGSITCRFTNV